jgi:hypothetical protein
VLPALLYSFGMSQTEDTFTDWLLKAPHRLTIKDLADDVRDDRNWPRVESRDGYILYLQRRGACSEAVETFKRAWRAWCKTQTKTEGFARSFERACE